MDKDIPIMDSYLESKLNAIISIYRDVHEGPPFEGKDTINFILMGEIVKLYRELDKEFPEGFLGCSNCKELLDYHKKL
jgi:hypothetical protein